MNIDDLQAVKLDAVIHLAEVLNLATDLGYTICVRNSFSIHPWTGKPLVLTKPGEPVFVSSHIDKLHTWLIGVAHGVAHGVAKNEDWEEMVRLMCERPERF